MGTRCLVDIRGRFDDADEWETITTIYRQFDGYPEGMGFDIKEALHGKAVVNGYSDPKGQLNGHGCVAAYLVGKLKKERCGNVYLMAAGTRNCGEEYIYTLSVQAGKPIHLKIEDTYGNGTLYDGNLEDLDPHSVESDDDE